jgi:hypothetical protein
MFFGTVFGVVIIPGLYYIFARLGERMQAKGHRREETIIQEA